MPNQYVGKSASGRNMLFVANLRYPFYPGDGCRRCQLNLLVVFAFGVYS